MLILDVMSENSSLSNSPNHSNTSSPSLSKSSSLSGFSVDLNEINQEINQEINEINDKKLKKELVKLKIKEKLKKNKKSFSKKINQIEKNLKKLSDQMKTFTDPELNVTIIDSDKLSQKSNNSDKSNKSNKSNKSDKSDITNNNINSDTTSNKKSVKKNRKSNKKNKKSDSLNEKLNKWSDWYDNDNVNNSDNDNDNDKFNNKFSVRFSDEEWEDGHKNERHSNLSDKSNKSNKSDKSKSDKSENSDNSERNEKSGSGNMGENKKQRIKAMDELTLKDQILLLELPENIKDTILDKLKNTSVTDYSKTIQWISSLLKIPFNKKTNMPIKKEDGKEAIKEYLFNRMKVLDNSVYGLHYVKEEILEFIAHVIRNPETKGNILAFKGPPGIGKTKLIKTGISEALGRNFSVINFGGLKDSSLLDGHDMTYVGAKYGRIVQILINAKTMDPVIYLDELDKISENHIDEISGILTHLLDEEQNKEFFDNYFQGIPIDLSKVLFVISFNDITKINAIVSDRMKIIDILPPDNTQKIEIVKNYILPEILNNFKLNKNDIIIPDNLIKYIITNKTIKEEGVRKLKKNISSIVQKICILELIGAPLNSEHSFLSYQKDSLLSVSFPISITREIIDSLLHDIDTYTNFMYI